MKPAIAQVGSLPASFEDDLTEYAAGHCPAVEVWFTKLENHLQQHSPASVLELLAEQQIEIPVASFQGGLLASQAEPRREAWELFARRLEMCRELKIGTVVIACDVPHPLTQDAIERTQASLLQVAQEAGRRGLRAALEFQARSAFGNNLQTAHALVAEVGSPHLGICLDAFHFFTGPSRLDDLAALPPELLFHVQLCDLADTPRELASDGDRILPGDGDFPLAPLIDLLKARGYTGHVSLEVLNPQLWQVPPRQFGEIAITALRKILGQAEA